MHGKKSFVIGLLLMCCSFACMQARAADDVEANAGWSGAGFLMQEKWGVLGVNVNNRTGAPVDVLVTNRFSKAAATVQYSQKVWVPAHATRRVWQPVRMPGLSENELTNDEGKKKKDIAIDLETLALEQSGGTERTMGRYQGVVRLENGTQPTGVLVDSEDDSSLDAVVAGRISVGIGPRLASIRAAEMPTFGSGLGVLDTFFLCRNNPGLDAAQMAALQNWILNGGRLWVMAEQVSPEFMSQLLGDDWSVQIVDHVHLMKTAIEGQGVDGGGPLGSKAPTDRKIMANEFEKPVDFARAVVSNMEVMHTLNGWPASARRQIGRGWLYVTFVGPEAMFEVTKAAPREVAPVAAIDWLASEFFKPVAPPPLQPEDFVNYLQQEIGHKIISRGVIVTVLGAFALLLLGTGLVLAKRGRLELIGPVGVVGALAATFALLGIGYLHRAQRPLMTVSTHLAEVWPAQNVAVVTGELGVYSPGAGMGPMRSLHGGVAWPDIRGQDGNILRMHWLDVDQWEWQNLTLPAGAVRASDVSHLIRMEKSPRLTTTLDETGATVRFDAGSLKSLDDMLLSAAAGQVAPRFDGTGSFRVSDDQILPAGQYIASGMQNQVQIRRQQMYKKMMQNRAMQASRAVRERRTFADRPMLLGWTENVKVGMDLVQDCVRTNSAMVTIPMEFDPVKPGTAVTIPAVLMTRGSTRVIGAQDMPVDRGDELQVTNTMDMRFAVKFFPPSVATPIRLSAATLTVDMNAPGRPVQIFAVSLDTGQQQLLATLDGPTQPVTLTLDKLADVELPRDGGVVLVVSVMSPLGGDVTEPASLKPWRVRDLRLAVKGTVN